jgi:hypothetical protein
VRNCSNRVSGSASGGSDRSDTNVPGRGRVVPKYTGRFSGWRGLRYGECHELQSESYVTTDGQPASLSWNKAPIWGLRPDLYYLCDSYGLVLVGRPL